MTIQIRDCALRRGATYRLGWAYTGISGDQPDGFIWRWKTISAVNTAASPNWSTREANQTVA